MRMPRIDYKLRYDRLTRLGHWLRDRYGSLPMSTLRRIDARQHTFRLMAELAGVDVTGPTVYGPTHYRLGRRHSTPNPSPQP